MSEIIECHGLFRLHCDNDLERYRCDSLLTKEPETVFWIEDYFRAGEVFYDIGANIGLYSLFARAKKAVTVFAFEPFLKNYARLRDNLELNAYADVKALNIALSDRCEISRFYSFDTRSGASGGQINAPLSELKAPFEAIDVQDVMTLSLDGLVEDFACATPRHIKVDVDGNEEKILAGMQKTLARGEVRSLLIEVNPLVSDVVAISKGLLKWGLTTDNRYNKVETHSRNRRTAKGDGAPENVIYTKI
jgi:FkbM family methyltransferase